MQGTDQDLDLDMVFTHPAEYTESSLGLKTTESERKPAPLPLLAPAPDVDSEGILPPLLGAGMGMPPW